MKKIITLISFLFVLTISIAQAQKFECVSCTHNEIDFTKYASGVGIMNIATGLNSFVGGEGSYALGDYSFAFGLNARAEGMSSISLMKESQALGMYSTAIGRGSIAGGAASFAIGYMNYAQAESSYLFGEFLKSTAGGSVTIGMGAGTGDDNLKNYIAYSLMVGFNSNIPTLFVGSSSGSGTTGKIGVGHITSPIAKLHILGDGGMFNEENASLFIQSASNDYHSYLWLGDTEHGIKAKPNSDLIFYTGLEQDFVFENGNVIQSSGFHATPQIKAPDNNGLSLTDKYGHGIFVENGGNVGIGIPNPQYLLDVSGDIRFTGQLYDAEGLFEPSPWTKEENGIFYNGGNVGIGTGTVPTEKLEVEGNIEVNGNINFTGELLQNGDPFETNKWEENENNQIFYNNGNVGIGTEEPTGLLSLYKNNPDENLGISFENGGSTKYWIGHNGGDNVFYLGGTGGTTPGLGAINILGGNVGIGNNSPGKALDVNGDINFTGDLYDNGQLIDINLWEENTEGIHYNLGNVGIGTNIPEAPLHINSNIWDTDAEFIKVENNGVNGSGTTIIGKRFSGGPVLIQQAGDKDFSNQGSTLSFIQKSRNNDQGLNISTYTGLDHAVRWVSISAITSSLTVKAKTDLVLQSGGTDPIHFATNGSPDGSPNGNPDSDGIERMEIN